MLCSKGNGCALASLNPEFLCGYKKKKLCVQDFLIGNQQTETGPQRHLTKLENVRREIKSEKR